LIASADHKESKLIHIRNRIFQAVFFCFIATGLSSAAPAPHVNLSLDATDAPRKIFHAQLTIPANPGTLTLYYPKWIPGEHSPSGPVIDATGLKFTGNGQILKWRRALDDNWTINIDVPPGVHEVNAHLDFVCEIDPEQGLYSSGASATDKMAVISWNQDLLYPKGWPADQITFTASLRLPQGWKFGTALPIASQSGGEIQFQPVPLNTLVDSPVITGEYFKVVPLNEGQTPPAEMDIAADSTVALDAPADVWDHYKNLVKQAFALFGATHYRDYHFLFSLSDHVAHFGLEHHESNDSRAPERTLIDPELRVEAGALLPHEYTHSWNGKYRRPADLTTSDYQQTMQDDLLWVYEGLTDYLGDVLAARSGLWTPEQYREDLARVAAMLDHRPGRTWRNLQDTADSAAVLYYAPHQWESWRRGTDFYEEDELNWLWVDTIIRQQSHGAKSIDDFCHLFHGAPSTPPMVKTYTFDDIVNALNQVVPYDWRGFWTERLTNHGPGAPLGGIEGSGWKLVYDANRSEVMRAREDTRRHLDATFSVGLLLGPDGEIMDTVEGMAAANAGIGPGMKIVAVNGRRFTPQVFRDALADGTHDSKPLQLIIENTDYFRTVNLDYHGGERYPHLEREENKPDLLSDIIRAH
jgi:predicted metalloprotease with PDZ domain